MRPGAPCRFAFVQVLEFAYPGAPKEEAKYPADMTAHVQWSYFEPKAQFSILGLLRGNLMVVMLIVGIGAAALGPKLTAMLDPDGTLQAEAAAQRAPPARRPTVQAAAATAAAPASQKKNR